MEYRVGSLAAVADIPEIVIEARVRGNLQTAVAQIAKAAKSSPPKTAFLVDEKAHAGVLLELGGVAAVARAPDALELGERVLAREEAARARDDFAAERDEDAVLEEGGRQRLVDDARLACRGV